MTDSAALVPAPTARDLERARALRESILAFIEANTKQRIRFRPYLAGDGRTEFPQEHIDRELARILAQARAEGRDEARAELARPTEGREAQARLTVTEGL
jgi:hypothetical protein